jgi:hypothetical protein
MWFLVVVVVNLQGNISIDLFQTEGKTGCYSKMAKTIKVLNHEKNTVKAFTAECKQAENT